MTEVVKSLANEYKFIIEQDPQDKSIEHIVFEDGRQYKIQHPSFMVLHEIMFDSKKSTEQIAFEYALTIIFPENEQSPKIDEKFLNDIKNFDEAMYLWSPLLRRLLLHS